ncbi:MAG TPA: DUF6538 domain-containing protein, partial [Steroidobacteraceae bacterium]
MVKAHLKLRGSTWFVRVKVSRSQRAIIGREEILRSLRTGSLVEANRVKHRVIAAIQESISKATVAATLSPDSADYITEVARQQRQS